MPLVLSRAIRLRPFMAFSSSSARRLSSHSPHPLSSLSARLSSPLFNNPLFAISHGVVHAPKVPVSRLTVRCKVTNNSGYSPLNNSSPNWSDRPPVETAPLFPGCDYEHWLIVMDHPNEGKATKQEMIDCYIQTLAKVLGSEEAAKKSIYNVSCERYFGFGCQIDEETSNKLVGSAVSGSKKIGRRKKSEHTETEAAEGASDGGKTRRRRKSEEKEVNVTGSKGDMQRGKTLENEDEDLLLEENYDECNGNNYENNWPPLVCCFGAAQNKFVPISARHMTPEVYMTSEGLHWNPAEFVRARGGPPSNVAIALAQLGGRVAFMGKVGNDAYGRQMVITFNMNNVQTRGIRIDSSSSTSVSYMKLTYQIGKLGMSDIKPCAEDSLLISEINVDLLKEVRMFHFNSMVLLTKSMRSTLHAAIKFSRKCGGIVFFDVNLPLPLWRSRDETWRLIQKSWNLSNVIEVSKQELEFLLGEDYREKRRKMSLQYSAHSDREMKPQQHYCYTREELFSLWHDDIKLLIVNDGANLYYYTTTFEGSVPGAEAVVTTPFICDRSATNDAFVADLLRMLVMEPELYSHQVNLEKAIRYATTSGIAAQWDIKNCVRQYAPDSIEYKMKKD